MTERFHEHRADLKNTALYGRTIAQWHRWLITDPETGENNGHLGTPGSRYGSRSEDCAWYAIAGQIAFDLAGGVTEDPEASMDWFMSDAVNSGDALAELLREYWNRLPVGLLELLDWDAVEGQE